MPKSNNTKTAVFFILLDLSFYFPENYEKEHTKTRHFWSKRILVFKNGFLYISLQCLQQKMLQNVSQAVDRF